MKNDSKKTAAKPRAAQKIFSCLVLMAFLCGTSVFMGSAAFRVQAVGGLGDISAAGTMPAPPLPPVKVTPPPVPSLAPVSAKTALAFEISEEQEPISEPENTPVEVIEEPLEPILASAKLDAETQFDIYELCDEDDSLFCAVMAIAREETDFNPAALGDSGRCVGMMQINRSFHLERMERLGVDDLTDPVQCAAVAIDYIRELSLKFGWVDNHPLYLAYNAGPVGAAKLNQSGVYSTRYTYEVLRYYNEFMEELNPTETEEGGT